jgi:hypothetical protein
MMFITGPPDSTSPMLPEYGERHLLGVTRVDEVVGTPGLRHRDAEAVHQQPAVGVGAVATQRQHGAMGAERARVAGTGADVLLAAEERRHQHQQGVVAAGSRDRLDRLIGEHRLALGALQVHHRRLAGNRNRLFE